MTEFWYWGRASSIFRPSVGLGVSNLWDTTFWFHSTTRSPLLLSGALTSVTEFQDNYSDGIPNYVYNVTDRSYDRILIVHETTPWPDDCKVDQLLKAQRFLMRRTDS